MKSILVVDDLAANLKFVESILKDKYRLILVKSGEKAVTFLSKNLVDMVLLDVQMPDMNGFEVYEKMKELHLNHNVPVIFLTADADVESEIKGLKMGAVDFIKKPFVPEVMINRIDRSMQLEELTRNLEDKVREKTMQIEQLSFETISTIASMIEAKDSYTKGHSVRVAEYSALIARELGWHEEEIQNLKYIALLHDIGKVGIPDNVLNKPGRLTEHEFNIIKSHTTIGGDILKDIETITDVDAGAKYHHERYNGTGYPQGLSGEEIPLVARIICIADAFDAMSSKRIYRESLSEEEIHKELINGRGTQFDPKLLDIAVKLMEAGKLTVESNDITKEKTLSEESSALINQIVKSIEEEAKKAEAYDYLTGLLNRKEGESKITKAMKEQQGCLAFVDLDNLKRTNDTMGHLAGDYALKTVGEVLSCFEDRAIISRLGGDEFLFYMEDVDKEEATALVEQIMNEFAKKKEGNTYLSVSSLSIGLCMTTTMDDYTDVVKKADRALYYVKQSGKCGYYFYNQDVSFTKQSNSVDLMKLVSNLKEQGAYNGTLNLEYREFTKVYDYVQHLGKRYGYNIQLVMITLEAVGADSFYVDERERAMTCMEKTIQESLRSVDVCTRYGSEQFVVILLNAGQEYIEMITNRIDKNFHQIYDKRNIRVSFNVADLVGLKS
ncbi:MAG: diguanylate cyclase [Lachnospiraceae bacterium]|nr:diguanylate cyclase [Lachnospiraceae bacterium]